ncbi:hypothetical protein Poli38472_008159 [Pythium oligandrum]|uniref:RZZ complex subunit KNTC1/ROD C-terminal domain-containing protein n=1 Tax=Pythium oligandrum TaxID=41045 RepID=A0A8K1CNA7_PYTOL|nr:hypothetical protein Poli38472_008159 [Pythium oligandrum]|eukprot:TMW65517.1 hypothetical protein Poli38472_008159 [Pythium oligandrum]
MTVMTLASTPEGVASHAERPMDAQTLYTLPTSASEASATCRRRWVAYHRGLTSVVVTGARELCVVSHEATASARKAGRSVRKGLSDRTNQWAASSEQNSNAQPTKNERLPSGNTTLRVPNDLTDFAISPCGGFVAVADESGVLHLFKSNGGALFAYPIVTAGTKDRIEVVRFASMATDDVDASDLQDLLVLTRNGLLLRLGNLCLSDIEQILAQEPMTTALRTIMSRVSLQNTSVGERRANTQSLLQARRYPSALYVVVGNHGHAVTVWKASASKTDAKITKLVARGALPDASVPKDLQYVCNGRFLSVLSQNGALVWLDWQTMQVLFPIALEHIQHFAEVKQKDTASNSSTAVAIARNEGNNSLIEVYEIDSIQRPRARKVWGSTAPLGEAIRSIASGPAQSELSATPVIVTMSTQKEIRTHLVAPPAPECDEGPENTDRTIDEDAVDLAKSLSTADVSTIRDIDVVFEWDEWIDVCINGIGNSIEDSREVVENLIEFERRVRQYRLQSGAPLPSQVARWFDAIGSVSYKWTTFLLILSGGKTQPSQLKAKWTDFCSTDLLELMQSYLRRGMMRTVTVLWQRHTREDAVQNIGGVLDNLPTSLPFSAYEKWLRTDVIPGVIKFVEHEGDSSISWVVESFAHWLLCRIQLAAEANDLDTALKLCSLLRPTKQQSTDSSFRWTILRLRSKSGTDDNTDSSLEKIDQLAEQLEHMKHLEEHHGFKISLALFEEETPTTIALSMLDRMLSPESVSTEITDHVRKYLDYCGVPVDDVLSDYIHEVVESSPATNLTEQAKLLAVVDEISDVEVRAKAVLVVLGSILPPFSPSVKEYTKKCVKWDTKLIDTIREHIRLMEIQDMLSGYGITHFKVGDPRSGSRLVSHILGQIPRASAFVDALRLVDAYSQLNCERAALEYFENLLSFDVPPGANYASELEWRSKQAKLAITELKKRRGAANDALSILMVMEEVVSFGLSLLELEEERQTGHFNLLDASGSKSGRAPLFSLQMLETLTEMFLPDAEELAHLVSSIDPEVDSSLLKNSELLCANTLQDIQKIRKIEVEWGLVISLDSLRDPEHIEGCVKRAIVPELMFTTEKPAVAPPPRELGKGKGKAKMDKGKRRASIADHGFSKRARTSITGGAELKITRVSEEQQDDRLTQFAFTLNRYASSLGMSSEIYHSVVAEYAAESGDILRAVQYSRDLFSRRRGNAALSQNSVQENAVASGSALKNISVSISKYTAMHTDEIYNLSHGYQLTMTPIQAARMRAPVFSLELLRYAICVCDAEAMEETFVLLKNATLLNDVLQFTQLDGFNKQVTEERERWRIYRKWFREDTCILPSAQTMSMASRFAIAEHRILKVFGGAAIGIADSSSSVISHQEFLPSKRFVSFLVENNAELLSLRVIMSMRCVPEDALTVVHTQVGKMLSTVYQSQRIDNLLALGLMLTMGQKDAFNSFRRQISRENVAKDFNRFQQLAKIGSDAARAWQQIAFLHQCVELEGNARWWHYLKLLDIECDHKAFQSERRDHEYIRNLVPKLLEKSNYDYYTILEFTRHYQIDNSYPALVYVEALLLMPPEPSATPSFEYQDRIVGVLEDIHEQRLVAMLLRTIPQLQGTDYDRLLFVFQLLLEHTSYREKEEVERRMEILHVLKALAASEHKLIAASEEEGEMAGEQPRASRVCFHRVMSKPREVLTEVLNTQNFMILANLAAPIRLQPDELFMVLLKNVVDKHRRSVQSAGPGISLVTSLSKSELQRLFNILSNLSSTESKITAGEWLSEHLPLSDEKLAALEFALHAAASDRNGTADSNTTFTGLEALTRLEMKIRRVKLQLILAHGNVRQFCDEQQEGELFKLLPQPKEFFYAMYRRVGLACAHRAGKSFHEIADQVASVLQVSAHSLRIDLIRELLIKDAVYGGIKPGSLHGKDETEAEDIFKELEDERRSERDEKIIKEIVYLAVKVADDAVKGLEMVEFLMHFARDSKPRAGVTFRAKTRAAITVMHLTQSHQHIIVEAVEKMRVPVEAAIKELVEFIRHCKHMVAFEEHRVPYEVGFVMRANKEALARSLLRQYSGQDAWIFRCVSSLMMDFNVQAPDLWDVVLSRLDELRMYRTLSRVLRELSQQVFVRSIEGAARIWENTLRAPLLRLKALEEHARDMAMEDAFDVNEPTTKDREDIGVLHHGIPLQNISAELETLVELLQKCPFLDHIDVPSFVVNLRDLTMTASQNRSHLAQLDLYSFAVRCAAVIPRPSIRQAALQRIIQSGAYMQVLQTICDTMVLSESDEQKAEAGWQEEEELTEQLGLLQTIFTEAAKLNEHEKLLKSPYEQSFLEFLGATGDIDRAIALLLEDKRLEVASTLVEMYFESHPECIPSTMKHLLSFETEPAASGRWRLLQAYVNHSSSPSLASYRQNVDGHE